MSVDASNLLLTAVAFASLALTGCPEECEAGRDCADDEYCHIKKSGAARCLEMPPECTEAWDAPCGDERCKTALKGCVRGGPQNECYSWEPPTVTCR